MHAMTAMKKPNIYTAFAVILPVALGLGLIYLHVMRGLDPVTAIGSILGLAVLMFAVSFLADVASDDAPRSYKPDSQEDRY
jgi:hypothetical protein